MSIKIVKRSVGSDTMIKIKKSGKALPKGRSQQDESLGEGEDESTPEPKLPLGSIDPSTGKKVMPKSPGRPKGTKGNGRVRKKFVSTVLGGTKGEQLQSMIKETATMTDNELLEKARQLKLQEEAAAKRTQLESLPEAPTDTSTRRDAMSTLCYRLSMRGLTSEQIANQMGISPRQVHYLESRLQKQLKLDPKTLDVGYYMGESLAFFQEVRQMALMASSHEKNSSAVKLRAMEVALQAEMNKNAFLTKIGVYSPTVVERIERWVMGTADQMAAPPSSARRLNLAAEVGKALSRRSAVDQSIVDVPSQ